MRKLAVFVVVVAVIAAAASTTEAGLLGLDRNSSGLSFDAGVQIDDSGGNFKTTSPWQVAEEFQLSLLGEEETPPNDEWNFNHYDPGPPWDWSKGNFADYPYYYLQMDSTGNIDASFYYQGATGEKLEWALYYTDSSGRIQTILGGTMEDTAIADIGGGEALFTTYLRIVPYATYRTFDGNGEGFVNTVEIWGGLGKPTDLLGYEISAVGTLGSWTSNGPVFANPNHLPEPCTLAIWGMFGASAIAAHWWRRRRKPA